MTFLTGSAIRSRCCVRQPPPSLPPPRTDSWFQRCRPSSPIPRGCGEPAPNPGGAQGDRAWHGTSTAARAGPAVRDVMWWDLLEDGSVVPLGESGQVADLLKAGDAY